MGRIEGVHEVFPKKTRSRLGPPVGEWARYQRLRVPSAVCVGVYFEGVEFFCDFSRVGEVHCFANAP